MIRTGLVSVTFRALSPREIVDLVVQGQQEGIEWGGDIHVPHGDESVARDVAAMTQDAGLQVVSYGSYYRVGVSPQEGLSFEAVLASAQALQAPTIRVWAGRQGSAETDAAQYAQLVADAQRIAELAQSAEIGIAFEFHARTLTDTAESAVKLQQQIGHANVHLYWQPPEEEVARCLDGLRQVLPYLSHVHVYHWATGEAGSRPRPLAEGSALWQEYLRAIADSGRVHFAMLEFVVADSPEQYLADAATLARWLEQLQAA
jgi:sugar phosphate isomerase/epimerase